MHNSQSNVGPEQVPTMQTASGLGGIVLYSGMSDIFPFLCYLLAHVSTQDWLSLSRECTAAMTADRCSN